jgi:asparagine synthase (glutamine-hydrolysing)
MLSDDGKIGIVFNGAIYNFQKLRSELVSMGYRFRSKTDTEVLIYGYKAWGIDGLLSRIDGMYAFGLWDESDQRLYLVRDRLGVKPLSFRVDEDRLYFASTPRAINKVCPTDLCDMAVAEFLEFGFVTDEQSIFQGISKVRAGELVQWDGQKLTRRFYWDLNELPRQERVPFEDAVLETEKRFLDAVEKRLQSDVPVGTLLSGGIDSSLVCWAVGELGGDVTSFTVGTPGEDVDEAAAAAATAKRLGVRHRLLQLRPTTTALIDELVDAYDEPFGAPSALAMLSISREVKEFATVLLTGDGGDDVFLGYPEHKHFYLSQRISRLTPPHAADVWGALRNAIPRVGLLKRGASFLDYSMGGLGAVGNARDGLPFYARNQLLGERILEISIPHRQMEWGLESGRDLLARFLAYDRVTRFVGEYLTKVDRATMYHGIEARSPFLDINLWEYAHTLPFSLHLYQGRTKSILREIARRRVGGEVAFRKKQGFVIPVLKWLSQTWRNEFDRLLDDSVLHKNGWIDARRVKRLFSDISKNQPVPRQLWLIFVLESWLRLDAEYMNPVRDVHTRCERFGPAPKGSAL